MCLFFILLMFGPRLALAIFWLFQTARFDAIFDTIAWPLLGIIFAPWTTMMYVFVQSGGVNGWDWFFLVIAFLIDMGSYGGTGYSSKDQF